MTVARIEFYLDTNVILDWLEPARANRTSEFIRGQITSESDLVGVVSTFALMEAVQYHQDNAHFRSLVNRGYVPSDIKSKERDLVPEDCARCYADVYKLVAGLKDKVVIRRVDAQDVWSEATGLQQSTNFSAPDAIHVGIALSTQCDFFVSSDQQLLQELKRLPRSRSRIIPVQTRRGEMTPGFENRFRTDLARVRKRHAAKRKTDLPAELTALVHTVQPIFSKEEDPKTFVRKFEARLRRGAKRGSKGRRR